MTFNLSVKQFKYGEKIPREYTCDGKDVSPTVSWAEVPASAKSLVLIMDDPDAPRGTFTHWVIYNISPQTAEIPENVPKTETLENGWYQGKNDFGKIGYGGPCPPGRSSHRYVFTLYAVVKEVDLKPAMSKGELLAEIKDGVIKQVTYMGKYGRK